MVMRIVAYGFLIAAVAVLAVISVDSIYVSHHFPRWCVPASETLMIQPIIRMVCRYGPPALYPSVVYFIPIALLTWVVLARRRKSRDSNKNDEMIKQTEL